MASILEREEYIEQAYFFRVCRERLAAQMATQEILENVHEEILSTTRLPYAIQFLATELKHSGCLSSGFALLPHYFTQFQFYVMQQTEEDRVRFSIETGLLVLEREAAYRAENVTAPGLFVYQFESLSRNRLGYDRGLECMAADPLYNEDWRTFLHLLRGQVGVVDFADIVYVRSQFYINEQRRQNPDYDPPAQPLFGEKEGKIAKANRGRDPLYLFAALQRQLNYPEVPRVRPRDDIGAKLDLINVKLKELELRLRLVEGEIKGQVDMSQFLAHPQKLKPAAGDDIP